LLCGACHRARISASRRLAMTVMTFSSDWLNQARAYKKSGPGQTRRLTGPLWGRVIVDGGRIKREGSLASLCNGEVTVMFIHRPWAGSAVRHKAHGKVIDHFDCLAGLIDRGRHKPWRLFLGSRFLETTTGGINAISKGHSPIRPRATRLRASGRRGRAGNGSSPPAPDRRCGGSGRSRACSSACARRREGPCRKNAAPARPSD
jgi:hypothetical protein